MVSGKIRTVVLAACIAIGVGLVPLAGTVAAQDGYIPPDTSSDDEVPEECRGYVQPEHCYPDEWTDGETQNEDLIKGCVGGAIAGSVAGPKGAGLGCVGGAIANS